MNLKQQLKMMMQNLVLPAAYGFWSMVYAGRKKDLIVFADAHHDTLPFSMQYLHDALLARGYTPVDIFKDYTRLGQARSALAAISFMRLYARTRLLFICDNFLPAASCRKHRDTTVVQLWHSCGLMKKMGYDTADDIPAGYRGNVYRNYDLVTVSAPCCVGPLESSMHQPRGVVQPIGVSRTDTYFDEAWRKRCREAFYRQFPDARNKKIILWAPTFRGNAADPTLVGTGGIDLLEKQLGSGYLVIRKVHPHLEKKYGLSSCDIPTEELFPVTDLLITDYSSAVFDFLLFGNPVVLYAPDLHTYQQSRGFYSPYEALSPYVVTQDDQLTANVTAALEAGSAPWISQRRAYHMSACDGHATRRILDRLGLK